MKTRAFCAALVVGLALFAIAPSAKAQQALVVDTCGTLPANLRVGGAKQIYQDKTGKQCVAASVSSSVTGFQSNGVFANLTATAASSASTALPAGATSVRITNAGTGTVSCTFATGAATGVVNNIQVGPSSSVSRAVGTFDHIACIDQTGSSGSQLVVIEGGSGLGNDTGGGSSSGGGGGAVTLASGAVASGAYASGSLAAGAGADGWDATQGSKTDAVATVPATGSAASSISLFKAIVNTLNSILTAVQGAIAAGTNYIGQFGIDPSQGGATPAETFLALPATTTTQIVALSGSLKTYVTSRVLLAGGSVNVTFKYGTGTNCATGTTTLDGPWPLTAQAGFSEGNGGNAVMIVPSGQALCVTTDASVSGGVKLTYQQK